MDTIGKSAKHLGHSLLVREGVRSTLLSRVHMENVAKIIKNQLFWKSSRIILEHLETLQGISNDSWTSPEYSLIDFTNLDFSWFCAIFEKWSDVSILPVKIQGRPCYHRKERRKSWEYTPKIIHLMYLSQRYHWSKGVRERQQEDRVTGNLASPGHLDESASHHLAAPADPEESASHHFGMHARHLGPA